MAEQHLPFFRMWVKDILGDNRVDAMTAEEFGAYVRLLLMAWQEDPAASLPPDEDLIRRWARLDTARWSACRERILACFSQVGRDGRRYQKRLREEYESAISSASKRSKAGRKGAERRWNGQENGNANGIAIDLPSQSQCDSDCDCDSGFLEDKNQEFEDAHFSALAGARETTDGTTPGSSLPGHNLELMPLVKRIREHYRRVGSSNQKGKCTDTEILMVLRQGVPCDHLVTAIDAYAAWCKREKREPRFRVSCFKFFEDRMFEAEFGPTEKTLAQQSEEAIARTKRDLDRQSGES